MIDRKSVQQTGLCRRRQLYKDSSRVHVLVALHNASLTTRQRMKYLNPIVLSVVCHCNNLL